MKNNLSKTALVIGGLGLVVLIYNFFKMYNLAGSCPDGSAGCKAYSTWHLLNTVGLVLLVLGITIFVTAKLNQNKKN